MRNVCKVLAWLSSSTAAALLALAVLAIPSAALADSPDPTTQVLGCYLACTDTCPAQSFPGVCQQDPSFCDGTLCFCNCDPVKNSNACQCSN